ncbi:MAG TPA: DinB family protein [Longimicrobiales bacterium]|nr:DinB family protein [Longimicrobiales bacterium]
MNFVAAEGRSVLERTPRVLDAWLRGLDDAWLDFDDGPGTWTPRQVLAHLIHGEKTDWIPRLEHMIEHGPAIPFERFDRSAHLTADRQPVDVLLDTFARARTASLVALDVAMATDPPMDRRGLHPDLGEVTLRQLLATWTAHDLGHILQIARTMARRYASDVGPWAQYLSVMAGVLDR